MDIKKVNLSPAKAKKLWENTDFRSVYNYDELIAGSKERLNPKDLIHSTGVLLSSDLHLELNKLVEKQNFTVPGKYKRARVYIFETDYAYVAAICETGDRGSCFAMASKFPQNNKINQENYLKDTQIFMRKLFWSILKNNQKLFDEATQNSFYGDNIKQLFKEEQIIEDFKDLNEKIKVSHQPKISQKNKI